MRLLYSLLYALALVFIFPFEYRKRPREIRRRWLSEKLGRMGTDNPKPSLWVHAVSVGEVLAADTFLKALKRKHPGLRVVVSTITDTGQAVARSRLGTSAEIVYMPFDLAFIMERAIAALRPEAFIVMETEMWPNAIWCMRQAGVPVLLLNGRMSESSLRGYERIRFFMKRVLDGLDAACMQDEEYARRLVAIGAPKEYVTVTGSFKFDVSLSGAKPQWGDLLDGPVIVAGSTHREEESLMADVYGRLKEEFANLNLIIAPRHPERFDEVEGILRGKGMPYIRRSELEDSGVSGSVVLLDTIGELSGVYALADVAVMGGSFIEHGGQNPLEPAYWGKPVVCGPHMENFPYVQEFYASGAAAEASRETLYEVLSSLLGSPEKRKAMGEAAGELLRKNRGAVDRAIAVVERYLEP